MRIGSCARLFKEWRRATSALAKEMTQRGNTLIPQASARVICAQVGEKLVRTKQIKDGTAASMSWQPTDHHVLERTIQATGYFQFQHQQFQEFYAASALQSILDQVLEDTELVPAYQRNFINWPAWEESLRMLAEKIAGDVMTESLDAEVKAKLLVQMCAEVDLCFAATLARLCAAALPQDARAALNDRLRRWYEVADEAHRELAWPPSLDGIPGFADLVTPLLMSEDQQIRLGAYRIAREFHLSILGGKWQAIVPTWTVALRGDFVSELTINYGRTDIAEHFGLFDPDVEIRRSLIRYLGWMRDEGRLVRAIDALPRLSERARFCKSPLMKFARVARRRRPRPRATPCCRNGSCAAHANDLELARAWGARRRK